MQTAKTSTAIDASFFARSVLDVAPELLGMHLLCNDQRYRIIEVEAYDGPEDKACHGRFGKTERTAVVFGPAGYWYLYLIYGMYWMLNIVTGEEGYPSAVLIRAIEQHAGPGKLTRDLRIDKRFNGKLASPQTGLWIEAGENTITDSMIDRLPRIGIDYAEEWTQKPYRFVLKGN